MASNLSLTLSAGNTTTTINEEDLYNPDGIEIHYGYDGRKIYGDADNYAYSAIAQTPGLHNITLSRPLVAGEEITLHWRNNYDLIIFCGDDGKTRVKKQVGGTYQEIGKWANQNGSSEETLIKFNDDVLTKRFDYIETKVLREF